MSTRISDDEALRVAEADAQTAYRDLTPYRIPVALEEDRWHIDYGHKQPGQ